MSKNADSELERRCQHLKAAAQGAGVKLTHQRLEIFREIASNPEHPDAEAVFRAVQHRMPTVSLDTVYRTLWMLTDLGLITTLGQRRDRVRFDANVARHHHYLCTRCGLVRDFESAALDVLRIPVAVKHFGTVIDSQVEVRGICDGCSRKRSAAPSARNRKRPRRTSTSRSQENPWRPK